MNNPKYGLMAHLRVTLPDAESAQGFVIDRKYDEDRSWWLYKLNLPDGGEFFECWFREDDLVPVY